MGVCTERHDRGPALFGLPAVAAVASHLVLPQQRYAWDVRDGA